MDAIECAEDSESLLVNRRIKGFLPLDALVDGVEIAFEIGVSCLTNSSRATIPTFLRILLRCPAITTSSSRQHFPTIRTTLLFI